ncbi:unnamed protein product [Prorocentrum cordatum]|uniref:Protein kinase domain-containing protein n=1 Tax=Prorocentrum cordatum TaxID=2364126 RepID=A0ABN9X3W1_9DINO|nr:unnamed protein product [Polarella glacialis]
MCNKRSVTAAEEVGSIYQEFCLLKHTLDHQHMIRCVTMLHSQSHVHLVLQYGGDACMEQLLSTQPGCRLSRDDALHCTTQVASALSYCHAIDVSHGQVSPWHVWVEMARNRLVCRLVDFSMAARVQYVSTRKTLCGALPCVALETALKEPYWPKPAACWSLGVELLEAIGGQGPLELSVRWRRGASLAQAALETLELFAQAGSHAQAMASMGGAHDDAALACLEALPRPEPLRSANASDVVEVLSARRVQAARFGSDERGEEHLSSGLPPNNGEESGHDVVVHIPAQRRPRRTAASVAPLLGPRPYSLPCW